MNKENIKTEPLTLEKLKQLAPSWENLVKLIYDNRIIVYAFEIHESNIESDVLVSFVMKDAEVRSCFLKNFTLVTKPKKKVKKLIRYVSELEVEAIKSGDARGYAKKSDWYFKHRIKITVMDEKE